MPQFDCVSITRAGPGGLPCYAVVDFSFFYEPLLKETPYFEVNCLDYLEATETDAGKSRLTL